MARPKGSKNIPKVKPVQANPEIGSDLKEGVIPEARPITKRCVHSFEHHSKIDGMCHSCGCMKFDGCGQ